MNRIEILKSCIDNGMLETIRAWRKAQHEAGMPSGFNDFFKLNNICKGCHGKGSYPVMRPVPAKNNVIWVGLAPSTYTPELPTYEPTGELTVCEDCKGSGNYALE